ncbi:polysaccharide biosynthesis tyrosine autokinase [Actinoplanes sp. M2I2]|uniref:polysaccharide biosynthesis tyrosine autokinase n=1 Tax=Actinoplanes sp. M2I2 TaxID=1734444 RepID=UPI0020225BB3|nr:AAA family ATPase [Actinoplanes sp. M2I2]
MTTNGRPVRLLRGYGWWIILVTVLVTAGAYALSRVEPVSHRSTATAVAAPRLRANVTPVPADAGTEREIARSATVLREVAADLRLSPEELADGLTVEPAQGSAITIAYTDGDATTARQRAQAVAAEYVRYRNTTTAQYGIAASLVSPAGPAEEQRLPLWLYLTVGAVAGLLLGLLGAVGLARRRDRLRGRVHYEDQTGLPVLATIPRARRPRGPGASLPVLLRSPDSADAESYRYLRARLDPWLAGPATVLVAGGRDGEGRSTTAANLAVALAQSGRRVVLVDADVRRPALHLMFDLSRDRGLIDVLTGRHTLAETLAAGAIVNLRVLAVGADRDNAADLLAAGGLTGLLHELKEQCDVVVLDSPALLAVADGIGLATQADHVLLVTDYRRSARAEAVRVAADLEQVAPGRVSAVLIGVPEREGGSIPRSRMGRAPAPVPAPQPPVDRFAVLDGPADPLPKPPPREEPAPPKAQEPAIAEEQPVAKEHPVAQEPPAGKQPPVAKKLPEAEPPREAEPAAVESPAVERPAPRSRPISAKAAIPKPRVYTSAAKAEAEARVEAANGLEPANGPAATAEAPAEK